HPCPCCGSGMRIIETFLPGQQPKHRPTPLPPKLRFDLTATTPKSRSPVAALSWPRLSSLQCCIHHATAAAIFSDTQAADQKTALLQSRNAIPYRSPHLAADLSCGPPTAKSPIAEPAAPPNTC